MLQEGNTVVARTILNGNSGAGIVLVENEEQLVDAPLYTVYIPKKQEYRVHVFRGQVLDVQRKARKQDVPDDEVNWKIRNMAKVRDQIVWDIAGGKTVASKPDDSKTGELFTPATRFGEPRQKYSENPEGGPRFENVLFSLFDLRCVTCDV